MRKMKVLAGILFIVVGLVPWVLAQQVQVEELVLDNGMTVLLVPRRGDPNVAAGWVAKVGSVNERPGITGLSHLFEHMMFKGTHVIGTKDIQEDLRIISELDRVKSELREEEQEQLRRLRLGEITDLTDPKNRSERHQRLLEEFNQLIQSQRRLLVSNEFDQIYTQAGASSMNAGTTEDFTIYFINVPANKLELWFWMESDRLANPVFREFYSERDVVHEERRMRTDSTPTGKYREQFNAMFWTSHPYSWSVIGWPSDLEGLTREEAQDYFDTYYAPNNIAACLVGDFDVEEAKELARKYFGRLERGPREPEPVRTREVEQLAEKRMTAYAETNPEVQIRYHTVADGHANEPALVVLGAILSGRTGRLYKSLVLEKQIANSAGGGQNGQKWAGYFELNGVAKQGHTPEEVEQGIYQEIEKLKNEPVGERELQKVKNQFNASNFRRIQSNFALMFQLLIAESGRGWKSFNQDPAELQAVTAEDVQRVAKEYFKPEARAVALYYRKAAGDSQEDPLLVGLSEEDKNQVKRFQSMMSSMTEEKLVQFLSQMELQESQVPQERRAMFEAMKKSAERRLQGLREGQQ